MAAALLVAKALAVMDRGIDPGLLNLLAACWQDVTVALLFWLADALFRRSRWLWIPYALMTLYVVVNAAVVVTLGSPLTVTMLRAAGGPLADSIASSITTASITAMVLVAAAAIAGPWLSGYLSPALRKGALAAGVVIVIAGATVSRRADVGSLGRNAFSALSATLEARVPSSASGRDFRESPFGARRGSGLAELRGLAAGRNVLLVGLESTGAQYLAPYGAPDDPTPSLTQLARESVVFDSAYAVYPESVKGLFALLCAASPAIDVPAEALAHAPCDSFVRTLSQAGYQTALFHAGRFGYLGMQDVINPHGFDAAFDAGAIGGRVQSSFGVDEPAVVDRVLSWIDGVPRDRPFFAFYMPAAGHHPYLADTDGPFSGDTDLGAYKNAIHEGDRALGSLLAGLKRRGLYDHTLILVFSDHGEAFEQHPGNRVHAFYIYDENVRIPLVMRVPGAPQYAGRRVSQVASTIDIGPTIVDLLGLAGSPSLEGASLLGSRRRMALFYADYASGWLGLRDDCWKYLYEIDARRSRLFDVCVDPGETRDLSAGHDARVTTYRDHALAWSAARRHVVLTKNQ